MPRTPSALLLLACLVGCESEVAPPTVAPVRHEMFDTQLIGEPVTPEADLAVIELVSAGAEPRARRFYQVAPGHQQVLVLKMAVRQTIESDGNAILPPQEPEATVRVEVTRLDAVDPRKAPLFRVQLVGIEHGGFQVAMVNIAKEVDESFERLVDYAFEIGISDDGRIKQEALLDARPALATLIDQVWNDLGESLSLPLPAEAIGLGAQWKVDTMSSSPGLAVTRTYELVKIEGALLHIREVQEYSIKGADFGLDPGTMNIKSMKGSGTGEHVIDLGQIGPIRSDFQSATQTKAEVNGGADNLTFEMDMQSERSVRTQ